MLWVFGLTVVFVLAVRHPPKVVSAVVHHRQNGCVLHLLGFLERRDWEQKNLKVNGFISCSRNGVTCHSPIVLSDKPQSSQSICRCHMSPVTVTCHQSLPCATCRIIVTYHQPLSHTTSHCNIPPVTATYHQSPSHTASHCHIPHVTYRQSL